MTEYERFELGDFDSVCEMLELLNTQRLVVSDMEKENEQLKQENRALKECNANNSFMIDCFADEEVRLITENEKLKKENEELKLQLTVEEMDKEALTEQTAIDIEHYTKQNEKLQDQISMLKTTIARNEAYIHQLTKQGEWRK